MTRPTRTETGVISMLTHSQALQRAPLAIIDAYWHGLAEVSGEVPARAQIDPRAIEDALDNAFLLHHLPEGVTRVRVAGLHLNDLAGKEVAGRPLGGLFHPKAREELARGLAAVFSGPAALSLRLSAPEGFGQDALLGEMTVLPLRGERGQADRAIGGVVTSGPIGQTPRRFAIEEMEITPIEGLAPLPAPGQGFAEPAAAWEPAPLSGQHLRLVISND
ncbi:PAS domain-containing protein [Roseivivax sp.]